MPRYDDKSGLVDCFRWYFYKVEIFPEALGLTEIDSMLGLVALAFSCVEFETHLV